MQQPPMPAMGFFTMAQRPIVSPIYNQSNPLLPTITQRNFMVMRAQASVRMLGLTQMPLAQFSLKMRKVRAKQAAKNGPIKKMKLKTKKSAQKRFRVVGSLMDRAFKYHAVGHRHLNRNKSRRNLKAAKRRHVLEHLADHKKMKRLQPYYKRRKALSG